MEMEEKLAKTRWCPFARVPGKVIGRDTPDEPDRILGMVSQNRGMTKDGALESCKCLGSDCMAWRWKHAGIWDLNGKATGFCGMAGVPK